MRTTKIYTPDLFEHDFGHEAVLNTMYKIIFENMTNILGENSALAGDDGKRQWLELNRQQAKKGKKTIIAFDDCVPCAFFQYAKIDGEICTWDEAQIAKKYQRDGVTFLMLIRTFLQDNDFTDCKTIRIYINTKNTHSQAVAHRIGFVKTADTERGAKYALDRLVLENWVGKHKNV